MQTYVIVMVIVMAIDVLAKMMRLYSNNTSYPMKSVWFDSLVSLVLVGWGLWALGAAK